ncbi:MAG: hypothetical protein ACP5MK_02745 [Candidatus Micrarchaeia archaeon]
MASGNFAKAVERLNAEPSPENWKAFEKALKGSGAKYYRIVYVESKLQKAEDLTSSYAELYNSRMGMIAKIPIFMRDGKNVQGATYYLRGLLNANKF